METLREAGEFGLIERLKNLLSSSVDPSARSSSGAAPPLILGIGDDAAAWHQPGAILVATTDMLVESIHFDLGFTSWYDLGWKSLAVNLSDVAAMGAAPLLALVSIGLRATTAVPDVEALYQGMHALARESGCLIAGGDTVSVRDSAVLNVAVLGSIPAAESETMLRRDRGRPGDVVAVTGTLGASAAGLHLLQHPTAAPQTATPEDLAALQAAHLRPQPRLAAGQALRHAGVRCAMDVSDGLLADLAKLCAASGCGAEIHAAALPIHPALQRTFPDRALAWAAAGGEDYELLCAAPAEAIARAALALKPSPTASPSVPTGAPGLTQIGRLTPEPGIRLLDVAGNPISLPSSGWDHFASHE